MYDVVVLGSANLDLVARTPRIPSPGETVLGTSYDEFPGGKGLNQAVAAARAGAATALVSMVGNDPAGTRLLDVAAAAGVDISAVGRHDELPTGRAVITVDDDGENSIVVVPGANTTVSGATLPAARVVLAQLEIPLDAVRTGLAGARASGASTLLDPAPATRLSGELLGLVDVAVPNEHEVETSGGVDALLAAGVGTVIVTRGAGGVTVHDRHGVRSQPAFPVEPIDTTGAGDAFCGALASSLAGGLDLDGAMRRARAAGALAATRPGAVPSLPSREEIDQLAGP